MPQPLSEDDGTWCAVGTPIADLDPWRMACDGPLQLRWASEDVTAAGFGIAAEAVWSGPNVLRGVKRLQRTGGWEGVAPPDGFLGPWYGGVAFDPEQIARPPWQGFPAARFVLPEVLAWRRDQTGMLWGFGVGQDARQIAEQRLQRVLEGRSEPEPMPDAPVVRPRILSDRGAWDVLVRHALAAIARGELSKVVAARALEVELARPLDVRRCTERLRLRAGPCATFLMRGSDDSAFLGATPERLCRIRGSVLETEALASSARPKESASLAREDKEQREHSWVVGGIREALAPLSTSLEIGAEPRLLELPYVSHLRTPVKATLRREVGLAEVLEAMYPTAAVGGAPREAARRFIAQEENWDRGWYAGAVGWVGPGGADLHVAIRSAWVQGTRARVFVGAGLVAGSIAEREWQETEDKARPMLQALSESLTSGKVDDGA